MADHEKIKLIRASLPGLFISLAMVIIMIWDYYGSIQTGFLGVHPLHADGLPGIITAPFIHGDFDHLYSNIIPFVVLSTFLFHFYNNIAWEVFIISWILTGLLVWLGARGGWHIGASGVVYALAAFHVSSGIVRLDQRLMAISFLTIFLYGGMLWGIFPEFFPGKRISWESHLSGMIVGIILAFYYRKEGPKKKSYVWEDEEDDIDDDDAYWKTGHTGGKADIRYE